MDFKNTLYNGNYFLDLELKYRHDLVVLTLIRDLKDAYDELKHREDNTDA